MNMSNNPILTVIKAADGQIIGRIRTQKIFYLLEQLGLNSGFKFAYHHYGPYSETLSTSIRGQHIFGDDIDEVVEKTSFGTKYSVYKLKNPTAVIPKDCGNLTFGKAKSLIETMKKPTSVVIELAATIHWLKEKEKVADWETELKKRKPSKATNENVQKAEKLLTDIGL